MNITGRAAGSEQRKSITAGAVAYLLLLAACVALIHPFVNTGISDDFSFIKSAKDFADTGRMVYNGWSSPILGWMLPFGALFIKLFGFSFTTVRLASFVLAAVNGVLLQWILLRIGCTRLLSLFGASAVLLSPISVPTVVLFFTDQPGLLALLVTVALCIQMLRASTSRATCYWIAAAFLASFVLGTARQLLWMCTFVMVPSAVWLVRRRRGVVAWAAVCFALSAVGIAGVMHWWNRQPYALREPLLNHYPLASWANYVIVPGLELSVVLAPVFSLFLRYRASRSVWAISALLATVVLLGLRSNPYDILHNCSHDIFGDAPQWIMLVVAAYACGMLPLVARAVYEGLKRLDAEACGEISFRELSVLVVPFFCALFAVVITRESFFARYLLPVMTVLAIWLIKLWTDVAKEKRSVGIAGPVMVAILCSFGVILTHDLYRGTDAILSLTEWYAAQGWPRNTLEAGFAFDGWYQIQQTGYINESRIKVPAGAYVKIDLPRDVAACHNFFVTDTPAIHPTYGVTGAMAPCFEEPVLHAVDYTTWMAPHRRTMLLARYRPQYALPAQ